MRLSPDLFETRQLGPFRHLELAERRHVDDPDPLAEAVLRPDLFETTAAGPSERR